MSVEVRVFWPPKATEDEIAEALLQAVGRTNLAMTEKRAGVSDSENVWLHPPEGRRSV